MCTMCVLNVYYMYTISFFSNILSEKERLWSSELNATTSWSTLPGRQTQCNVVNTPVNCVQKWFPAYFQQNMSIHAWTPNYRYVDFCQTISAYRLLGFACRTPYKNIIVSQFSHWKEATYWLEIPPLDHHLTLNPWPEAWSWIAASPDKSLHDFNKSSRAAVKMGASPHLSPPFIGEIGMNHWILGFSIISDKTTSVWWARATPLKNMSSSIGMMRFPIYGKIKMFQTTNQPCIKFRLQFLSRKDVARGFLLRAPAGTCPTALAWYAASPVDGRFSPPASAPDFVPEEHVMGTVIKKSQNNHNFLFGKILWIKLHSNSFFVGNTTLEMWSMNRVMGSKHISAIGWRIVDYWLGHGQG